MDHARDSGPFDSEPSTEWPRRFSWPMWLFLCFFVGDMFVRSLLCLSSCDEWQEELAVNRYPRSLPTPAELQSIEAGESSAFSSRWERLSASIADLPAYFSPIPNETTRAKLTDGAAVLRYAATWIESRLNFIGNVTGVDQGWPMFSPNAVKGDTLARFRLVYQDKSTTIHRSIVDPEDPTRICHFMDTKMRRCVGKAHEDCDVRLGYCMWLAKDHRENNVGSPLASIEVFQVRYEYPRPTDDAWAFIAGQTGPPQTQQKPPFWIYDVRTRSGRYVP